MFGTDPDGQREVVRACVDAEGADVEAAVGEDVVFVGQHLEVDLHRAVLIDEQLVEFLAVL